MDVMNDDIESLSERDLKVAVVALRGIVRLERINVAAKERDVVRWMREAAGYRGTLADETWLRRNKESQEGTDVH